MQKDYDLYVPSQRLRFAMEAAEELPVKYPNTQILMSTYHCVNNGKCFACLGGAAAIMLYKPEDIAGIDCWKALSEMTGVEQLVIATFESSIDKARIGLVDEMFRRMELNEEAGYRFNCIIRDNDNFDSPLFKADMEQLIEELAAAGY
jgi:hypothetical protein